MNRNKMSFGHVKRFAFILLFGFCQIVLYGQNSKEINGTVVDESGIPLPGVTILAKGLNFGATTDFDGQFTITVPSENTVLVFSYVGFITTEKSASDSSFEVVMVQDIQSLNEVVIVGYGEQKKATVTGSISTLKGAELTEVPTSNLSTAVTGKLSGVVTIQTSGRPGADAANIYIRGLSTWVDSSPLIIVDGVERASFSQIDPNEVESISVLKDASSTAVYGVRGANGVILITTKRGKEGVQNISFTAELGGQTPVNIPNFLNSYDHLQLLKVAMINDGKDPSTEPLLSDESLEGFRLNQDPYLYPNIKWYDEVVKPMALIQKYNMNVSGGTKRVKYFVSMGYLNQSGMFKYTDMHDRYNPDTYYKRFNFRSNLDFTINKYQTLSVNVSGRSGEQNGFPNESNVFQTLIAKAPYLYPIFNPDGTYGANIQEPNPIVKIANSGYDNTRTNDYDVVGTLKNDLSFVTDGLELLMNMSYNSSVGSTKSYREQADSYYYNPGTQEYQQIIEFSPLSYSGETSTGSYRNIGLQFQLKYGKTIGKSELNTTLVYNQQNERYSANSPFVLMGYAGRVEYNYDSKYLAEFNIGYNGSENFAPGNQFGVFPAGSFGYVISEEPFMKSLKPVIDFLKIRGSVGLVGNDKVGGDRFLWQGLYSYTAPGSIGSYQNYSFGTTNPSNTGGLVESRSENRNLTWETSLKRNIGIDAKLFKNNLLNITFDLFDEHRTDILMSARSLLNTTGIPSPQYNIGETKNSGFELELNHKNNIGDFEYSVRGLYSFARNEVVDRDDPSGTPDYQKLAGYRIGQYRGYQVLGYFTSEEDIANSPDQSSLGGPIIPGDLKYLDYDEDGQITSADIVPIGYSNIPEIVYSISPEVKWKGFTLSAMLQGAANSSVLFVSNAGYEFGGSAGGGQVTETHKDYWTVDNPNASYPSLHSNATHSNKNTNSFHLKSGNYLRLRNVRLSYSIPESFCNKLKINSINVSISGNNLKTWSEIDDFDPETVSSDGSKGEVYPQQSIYNFGVNIKL
ncbi:SusC/RagA family TonB-linked outer membrane protein [Pseudalgibacter alginicilyticus]|uniref:SusC/RagA family TonB-linked outer membrane protein n=2 Tax=Pseudalgibacter alginicilyticus TaxID=1736674 RepID=A0A0P0CKV2_9FLAO|nr:SusC/RagA family TonB-linked outer membrane protein [Pseudalgibacter alginicilyticus]